MGETQSVDPWRTEIFTVDLLQKSNRPHKQTNKLMGWWPGGGPIEAKLVFEWCFCSLALQRSVGCLLLFHHIWYSPETTTFIMYHIWRNSRGPAVAQQRITTELPSKTPADCQPLAIQEVFTKTCICYAFYS